MKRVFAVSFIVALISVGLLIYALSWASNHRAPSPVPALTQITVMPIAVDGQQLPSTFRDKNYHISIVAECNGNLIVIRNLDLHMSNYLDVRTLTEAAIKRESPITFIGRWKSGVFVMVGIEVEGKGMMLQGDPNATKD